MKKTALAMMLILAFLLLTLVGNSHFERVHASTEVESIPKPSVPEFTLKFVDNSFDVPPTYDIDPYTGKNVMTQAGYHVENKSIQVTIKNQPFSNYKDANGTVIMLYYDIRLKGHFGDYWNSLNSSNQLYLVASSSLLADNVLVYPNSPSTVLSYGFSGNNGSDYYSVHLEGISAGGQVDFQVQALIGYYTKIIHPPSPSDVFSHGQPGYHYAFTGEASDWSNTQTVTVNGLAFDEETTIILEVLAVAIVLGIIVGLLVYFKKRRIKQDEIKTQVRRASLSPTVVAKTKFCHLMPLGFV
jgi:uncharacterized membrane protein YciS (DUF1049 family)